MGIGHHPELRMAGGPRQTELTIPQPHISLDITTRDINHAREHCNAEYDAPALTNKLLIAHRSGHEK